MALSSIIVQVTPERESEIRASIAQMSDPGPAFYVMVVLSTTIAAFGLLADSTAVVIGAMLVAPLMGPIFGMALGVTVNDRKLFTDATIGEVFGAALVVVLAGGIATLFPHAEFGREILSRTEPNLYDLVVAFASGLAGAYALVDRRLSPALPGVAIATALVPPLTASGLCFAEGHTQQGIGALLLFVANLLAIETASSLIFRFSGLKPQRETRRTLRSLAREFGLRALLILVVGLYLGKSLLSFVSDRRLHERAGEIVGARVARLAGARLDELQIAADDDTTLMTAIVITPREIEARQVASIQSDLRSELDLDVRLIVRSVIARDIGVQGIVYASTNEARAAADQGNAARLFARLSSTIREQLAAVDGAELVDVLREEKGDSLTITAIVRTPFAIDPAVVQRMQDSLRRGIPSVRRLIVRSVLTRDADCDRFIFDPREQEASPQERAYLARLRTVLDSTIVTVPGARLNDVRFVADSTGTRITATVASPAIIPPRLVEVMQGHLRSTIDSSISLVVRTSVDAWARPDGFVRGE